jgi:hypothetical protein
LKVRRGPRERTRPEQIINDGTRRRGDESGVKEGRDRKKGVWRKDKIENRK